MISTLESTLSRFRRDMTLSRLLRFGLAAGGAMAVVLLPMLRIGVDGIMVLGLLAVLWLFLGVRNFRQSQKANESSILIASGQFEEAETRIDSSLRSFSIFGTVQLLSLYHLAVLRHAQRRWHEAAVLCNTVLGQRLRSLQNVSRQSLLLLADALLHIGDVAGAGAALNNLYRQKLSLGEALSFQSLELDYMARIGAWDQMLHRVGVKVQLAELMPSSAAARCQAMLALAAAQRGNASLSQWLAGRAALLADVSEMVTERPGLAALWPAVSPPPAVSAKA